MLHTARRSRGVLTAGVAVCLASATMLTACAGGDGSDDAAASSSAA